MVLAAAGCSGSDAGNSQASDGNTPSAENGGSGTSSKDTLIIANTAGEPGNLHPYNTVSIGARLPQYMVFDGLIELDTSGRFSPVLQNPGKLTRSRSLFICAKVSHSITAKK